MFDKVEVQRLSKAEYERRLPELRLRLLNAQFDLKDADFSVLVLIAGDDHAGADELVDVLHAWMDARHFDTRFFGRASKRDRERPLLWRYWRELPRDGRVGLWLGAWTINAVAERLSGRLSAKGLKRRLERFRRFERALVDDGTLILKFWIRVPAKWRRKLRRRARKHPFRAALAEDRDWKLFDEHPEGAELAERVVTETSADRRRWLVVDGRDPEWRNVVVAGRIADAIEERLSSSSRAAAVVRATPARPDTTDVADALAAVDLRQKLDRANYRTQLAPLQAKLGRLSLRARRAGLSTVLAFEGWDAAGKGGTIRRMTSAMSARDYRVIPIGAPTDEEKARHYLWRFWRQLPHAGRMTIFDRTWYGRVLVERVEEYARPDEWSRAYAEIVEFETELLDHGLVLLKFWLHIDADEQLRRFEQRERTPYKKYKITDEDYRNRKRRAAYEQAINEMIARTSTPAAPWHVIPSNDKRHARIEVLRRVSKTLKKAL